MYFLLEVQLVFNRTIPVQLSITQLYYILTFKAVMEMMGKTFHSKAIREVDAKENETEEK